MERQPSKLHISVRLRSPAPVEPTLGSVLRAVGLPSDLRAALVAIWLADLSILDSVREALGSTSDTDSRNFILSPRFGAAVRKAKPDLADSPKDMKRHRNMTP